MNEIFDSPFCNVQYIAKDQIVYLTWKKFCSYEDYREPTLFASSLLKTHDGANFVIDARNGFEDEKDDVEWGFRVLLPDMATSSCKVCVFILEKKVEIEDEIDLWGAEFGKYFRVEKVTSYQDAIAALAL